MRGLFIAIVVSLALSTLFLSSCKEDSIFTGNDAMVSFSTDTLTFDTVFVTFGSTTKHFKIFNPYDKSLRLSSVRLLNQATNGNFRINVDGVSGDATDVIILPKDSIYVFVEVTVDPNAQNLPFVIEDYVEVVVNGNVQTILLQAWGQNAYFHYRETIQNANWLADKPHVIVGGYDTAIDAFHPGLIVEGQLNIPPGTDIYIYNNSAIFVDENASIRAQGTASNPIRFEGVRLESFYDGLPGQWLGIFIFRNSTGNIFEHVIIDETSYGINLGVIDTCDLTTATNNSRPEVELNQVVIRNSFNNALFSFNSVVRAKNCLFYNSVEELVALGLGGDYRFSQCTFFNGGSVAVNHNAPNLLLSNFAEGCGQFVVGALNEATFTNCIIYGSLDEELSINQDSAGTFNFLFDHCLIKTEEDTAGSQYQTIILNQNPLFESTVSDSFQLMPGSPAIDAGTNSFPGGITINNDLYGGTRPQGSGYDLGAIESQ
jgi:hypothetical protein